MFIGRKKELDSLEDFYADDKFNFSTIRGRRRVGKSTLLKEFCKDKPHIYFMAQEQSAKDNLVKLSAAVSPILGNSEATFNSYEALFEKLFQYTQNNKLVFVIDEFPYLATAKRGLMSILQELIDKYEHSSKMFLILCGSSISFMEKRVLSSKAPLYGRSTGRFKLKMFNFYDALPYFDNYSNIDKIIAFSCFGGIPAYLQRIKKERTIKENIKRNFLRAGGYIFEEPTTLLKEEFREPAIYSSIIEAIANGYSKLNDIATKIDETTAKTANYIRSLIELQLVEKEQPITEKATSKKTIYKLNDNMFKFWYKFVSPNISSLEMGDIEQIYESKIAPKLSEYCGFTFEEICKQFFWKEHRNNKKLPFLFFHLGRWWGNNAKLKQEEEIDFIAYEGKQCYFCECKWRNEKTGLSELNELKRKAELLQQFDDKYYVLFSKSGFKKELLELKDDKVLLYDVNDICS